jgi:ribosomal protein S18 acetylase RimI-like enzyme
MEIANRDKMRLLWPHHEQPQAGRLVYNNCMETGDRDNAPTRLLHLVRPAVTADHAPLTRLLRTAPVSHLHVDWQMPGDWLGEPGFIVAEPHAVKQRGWWSAAKALDGCLAAIADPLPAAWIRAAAVAAGVEPLPLLAQMLHEAKAALRPQGVTELGWLPVVEWNSEWLPQLGFERVNEVQTYLKTDTDVPPLARQKVVVRAVQADEMAALAAIEEAAFEPLWRHSAQTLAIAWRQAISFDVAVLDGRLAGFQYSARGEMGAHLCRITVHPEAQRQGVASALLSHALGGYRQRGLRQVTLNTQADNGPSQRLYEKFGFAATNQRYPLWRTLL